VGRQGDETSGDYGYDLVHEETGRRTGKPGPETAGQPPSDGTDDAQGDYGYDEAHDFR
jgi:hypothetical protein